MKQFVAKSFGIDGSRTRGHNGCNAGVSTHTTKWAVVGITALLVFLLAACSSSVPQSIHASPALADKVIFYDWYGDMPQSVLDAFTEEYGVEVQYEGYDSQEEAMANMLAGEVYDVVIIDNDILPDFMAEDLLAEIDYTNVPNFNNIAANFRDLSYDPHNKHSIPLSWGSTALVVRSDLLETPITRWADLWDLQADEQVGFRLDEAREPLGVALKALGFSINTKDPEEVEAALEHLQKIKENIIPVESYGEAAVSLLASGELVALVGWSGDVFLAREEGLPVDHVYPEEGMMLWGDNYVIPANSPRKYTAEVFLNFLLRPEISAMIVNEAYYATPNEAAYPFIDPEIQNDPVLFPSNEDLQNGEVYLPLSPEATILYNEVFERF